MLVQPNFDDVPEAVEPGTYKVIIKKSEVKEWPNGGQYINWELETTGSTTPKNNGRKIFTKTSTSGKGVFMLQALYRAAVGQALTGQFDTEQLIGKQLAVDVADGVNYKTGEPTGYIEVKKFKPAASVNP